MIEFAGVLEKIVEFTKPENYVLFYHENEEDIVKSIMTQFMDLAKKYHCKIPKIELLPLTYMFVQLRLILERIEKFKITHDFTFAIAANALEIDLFCYKIGSTCDRHMLTELNIHCALSRPTRWAWTMLDHIAPVVRVSSCSIFFNIIYKHQLFVHI